MNKLLLVFLSVLGWSGSAVSQTQLKFWINSSLNVHEKTAYQKAADEFSQKNPNVKVSVEVVPGSETDVAKLMTAVRIGAGPDIAVIDRFYPSSRLCRGCGAINETLTLSDRYWVCDCGMVHDRDLSAAVNIRDEGLRMLAVGHTDSRNARGRGVRLPTGSNPG